MGSACSHEAAGTKRRNLHSVVKSRVASAACPRGCTLIPSSTTVMFHAIPHHVVSQILRPEVAGFLPADKDRWCATIPDAQCCVTEVKVAPSCDTVAVLEYAAQFPLVESLSLRGCNADRHVVCGIVKHFPNLQELDLSHSNVTEAVVAVLPRLTELRTLQLSYCRFVDSVAIAHLVLMASSLEALDLRGCCLDNASLIHLTKLHSLKALSIEVAEDVDTAEVPSFRSLVNLETLSLQGPWSVDADVLASFSDVANLRELKLCGCTRLDAASLAHIANLRHLQHLDLSGCTNVDAAALKAVARLKMLESLNMSCCWHVDAAGIQAISSLPRLKNLIVGSCCKMDTAAVQQLAKLPALEELDLSYCANVDAAAVAQLHNAPRLRVLRLGSRPEVDYAALGPLTKAKLRHLDVRGCSSIDADSVVLLSGIRPPERDSKKQKDVPWQHTSKIEEALGCATKTKQTMSSKRKNLANHLAYARAL